GHTWPPADALTADVLVIGHEHPQVRLEDDVGGAAIHRVWLRGRLRPEPVADHHGIDPQGVAPELIVMPAFNELSGGTFVNRPDEDFLVPYLPEGLADERVYLLDGTLLGPLASV
ncbi:MAG: phosphoesterase, partial [Halobacteriota archaeon]